MISENVLWEYSRLCPQIYTETLALSNGIPKSCDIKHMLLLTASTSAAIFPTTSGSIEKRNKYPSIQTRFVKRQYAVSVSIYTWSVSSGTKAKTYFTTYTINNMIYYVTQMPRVVLKTMASVWSLCERKILALPSLRIIYSKP